MLHMWEDLMNIISLIISIFSLIIAIFSVHYSKKQADISKEHLKEKENQYRFKNNVVFSVKWETDALLPRAKKFKRQKIYW